MSFDSRTFRNALGFFTTGVTVVTTVAGDGSPVGVTVSSFTSLSLEPPLVLFCLDDKTLCLDAYRTSGHFAVNVLRHDQRDLSQRFASRSPDKWQGIAYERGAAGGMPILSGCLATFECTTVDVRHGGDHLIFIGQVDRLTHSDDGRPLVYYRGGYVDCNCAEG